MSRGLTILMWVCAILAALGFIAAGIPKVMQIPVWVSKFADWHYPAWFVLVIGIWEVVGAVLLLIPRTSVLGAIVLVPILLGATYTHIRFDPPTDLLRPLIFLALISVAAYLRHRRQTIKSALPTE